MRHMWVERRGHELPDGRGAADVMMRGLSLTFTGIINTSSGGARGGRGGKWAEGPWEERVQVRIRASLAGGACLDDVFVWVALAAGQPRFIKYLPRYARPFSFWRHTRRLGLS